MSKKSQEMLADMLDEMICGELAEGRELDDRIHEMLFQKFVDGDLGDTDI